jgi:hypothetical protein
MEQPVQPHVISTKKRPTFLLVLCILSFIGIGFIIISSLITLLSSAGSMESLEHHGAEFNKILGGTDIGQMMAITRIRTIFDIIAAFICLAGVILMWKLKKAGYFIYIIGEIAPFIVSSVLFWKSFNNPFFSFVFWMGTVLAMMFSIAFIIMYGINLKHMS